MSHLWMVCTHMKYLVEESLRVNSEDLIGVFLYGSQNYGLDTADSDMDMIILTKKADKACQEIKSRLGVTKIFTLSHFVNLLKRGDLECLEVLFSTKSLVNDRYTSEWESFVKEYSECLNYNKVKRSLLRKLAEHLDFVLWNPYRDVTFYNKKRLYWAIRVMNQLKRVSDGESFESSLVCSENLRDRLVCIKTGDTTLTVGEFSKIFNDMGDYLRSYPKVEVSDSLEGEKCLNSLLDRLSVC